MMAIDPVYHFHQAGVETVARGHDEVKGLYRMWSSQTNHFVEQEEVAVAATSSPP